MRDDQADPAHHTRHRHARRGDKGGRKQNDNAHPLGVHTHRGGLVVAHGKDVDAPAQREQHDDADRHGDGGECDVGVESTVVSVVGEKPTLFRPGHITLEDLERALGEEVEVSKAILEKLPEGAVVRSPGMKYKHYAPKADVTLLDGTFEQFKAYVDAHAEQNPSCLCFTGEAEKLGVPCVEYGREGDGADQAKHIFRCLRALDEQGDAVVYARCPQKDGLSMAVYNRLIRAAAFRVIKL